MNQRKIQDMIDLVDVQYLQRIQDSLDRLTGITTVILTPDGNPVATPSKIPAFCTLMHTTPAGTEACRLDHMTLLETARQTRQTAMAACPYTGFMAAAVPIFLGDLFLGAWLMSQAQITPPDPDLIERTARQVGLDSGQLMDTLKDLPVIGREQFDLMVGYLTMVTDVVTDMARMNQDIMARNQALERLTRQLDASLLAFREFIDLSDVGVYLVDYESGSIILHNQVLTRLFGRDDDDLTGQNCYSLMGCENFCPFCPCDRLLNADHTPGEPVVWEHYNEMTRQWLRITSRALHWIDGRLAMMTTFVDITDRKRQEEEIAFLAYHDQRLRLPNALKLTRDLAEGAGEGDHLICFDLQGLRAINEVYGRETGDTLLREITEWVGALPGYDLTLYRVEGDDFAILLRGCPQDEALALARRIYARFEEPWVLDMGDVCQKIYAGVHIGVIGCRHVPMTHDQALMTFERVLSLARRRSTPLLYDEAASRAFDEHTRLEVSLKNCVLNGMTGFSLHYQPIVDAASGVWIGLEALCRWRSPDVGQVPPDTFIHEAEQLGLIDILGDWVFEEAIRQTKVWKLDQVPNFVLDINVSPIQLNDRELAGRLKGLLDKHDYPPQHLSLEITESYEIPFEGKVLDTLEQLRRAGITLSLDDFGTGYATFANLKNLPLDTLKTDRSFVNGVEDDALAQHTVRIMVAFAQAVGLSVVAEGVETEEQYRILQQNGVDMIQGYYFSRPLPVEELARQLDRFRG